MAQEYSIIDGKRYILGSDEEDRAIADLALLSRFVLGADTLLPARAPIEATAKERITLTLDKDLIEKLHASGKGWQQRVNDILKESLS
jgi:hypothetical protein